MGERVQCEFSLIRYVPDPVKGEFANIGVVLRGEGTAAVRFTRDWSRVRCLDPDADVGMLEGLEAEIAAQLGTGVVERVHAKPVMEVLEDSFSNNVQISAARGTLAESLPAEMEALLRLYVEPRKAPARSRKPATGRAALAGRMRDEFERAGVWPLMRKRVPAREYTEPGDPLRLDCGYRNGQLRLFHAVSLESEAETAKSLAYSLEGLRIGVERVEGTTLELTALVEPIATVSDPELYRFGVGLMEQAGLRVLTAADLGRVAETARRELRV